jgi:hypothetical protein
MENLIEVTNNEVNDINQWKLDKEQFVEELKEKGPNYPMISSRCIRDLYSLSYKLVKEWSFEDSEDIPLAIKIRNIMAIDISCLLINEGYIQFLFGVQESCFVQYRSKLINLLFDNYHLANASERKHFDKKVEYFKGILTSVSDYDEAA